VLRGPAGISGGDGGGGSGGSGAGAGSGGAKPKRCAGETWRGRSRSGSLLVVMVASSAG
jgi:hypothetical protein